MVDKMKKHLSILTLLISILTLCACDKIEEIPQIENIDQTATSITLQQETPSITTVLSTTSIATTNTTVITTTTTTPITSVITTIATTNPITTTTTKTTPTPISTTKTPITTTKAPVTTKAPATTTTPTTTTTKATTTASPPVSNGNYTPLNYDIQEGVWISFFEMDNLLFQASGNTYITKSETDYKNGVIKMLKNVKDVGANTVYVHIRAFSDSYYNSKFYPVASKYGKSSIDLTLNYDPIEIFIKEAHNLGLSFHAWINPLRSSNKTRMDNISSNYLMKQWYNDSAKYQEYITYIGSYYFLNPAISEVRKLVCDGTKEIVENYDVDGIHMDDYFYPIESFVGKTNYSFDKQSFSASGQTDLFKWRTENINKLVKELYSTVKSVNSKVEFGISPSGNIENNTGSYYSYLCADVYKWTSEAGYLDYIAPQIYFGYDSFVTTAKRWNDMIKLPNIKLVFGLAPYKIGTSEWSTGTDIIAREIESAKKLSNYSGIALYRYDSLFAPLGSVADKVAAELISIKKILS